MCVRVCVCLCVCMRACVCDLGKMLKINKRNTY